MSGRPTKYEAISYMDGTTVKYTNSYSELDADGDTVTLCPDSYTGWIITNRQIRP